MSINISEFSERVDILNSVLEKAYYTSKRRTKKSIKNIQLQTLSWGDEYSEAFRSIQESIRNCFMLSHLNPKYSLCVFKDASEEF